VSITHFGRQRSAIITAGDPAKIKVDEADARKIALDKHSGEVVEAE
jgi:hypothetical protein